MKKAIFIPLFLACYSLVGGTNLKIIFSPIDSNPVSPVFAIDTVAIGRVLYQQDVQLGEEIPKNGTSVLLFNAGYSLYFSLDAPKDSKTVIEDNMAPRTITGDKCGFPYFKMHREQKIFYRARCINKKETCLVEDTLGAIAWLLQPEHKRFGKFDCRRATGLFRGREYEAWYTLEIPIPSGPFKFGGLPGLILELQSTDGKVKFLFSYLEIGPGISLAIKVPPGENSGLNYNTYAQANWERINDIVKKHRAAGSEITISPSQEVIELWEVHK
ncbi:MAG: GLPGLI family protein [Saprospiraceae bacterium]